MNKTSIETHCPQCGKKDTWKDNNPYKPFCTERCKLIDLGDWASEKHQIAGQDGEALSEDMGNPEEQ